MSGYSPEFRRALPDGRVVDIVAMTFGKHRLHIAPYADAPFYDDGF